MKLFTTIIFFIIIPEFGISQTTLGLRINNIFHINSEKTYSNEDLNYSSVDEFKANSKGVGLIASYRKQKSVYSLRFDFFQDKDNRNLSEIREGTEDITLRTSTIQTFRIGIGFERILSFDKLDFYYGIAIPVEFRPNFKGTISSNILDSSNILLGSVEYITHYPNSYYAYINLPIRIYHNFGRFGIGLELINGIRFQKPGKTTKQEVRQYDSVGELIETSWDEKQDDRFEIQKISTFSIGFQYKFGDRGKLKK